MVGKKTKLDTEAISEFLFDDTDSDSSSEASDFEEYLREEEEEVQQTTAAASLNRHRTTGRDEWQIKNLGTTSRKEHKYLSFVGPAKGLEKS